MVSRYRRRVGRRGTVVAVVVATVLVLALAVPVLLSRRTHDQEASGLRKMAAEALRMLDLDIVSIRTGFNNGGSGSADCGVHTVVVVATALAPSEVQGRLDQSRSLAATAYAGPSAGQVVIVAVDLATTGADSTLDFRCRGPIPYEKDH